MIMNKMMVVMAKRMTEVSFDDFLKLDIRCGTIVAANLFPEARKSAVKLEIDIGGSLGQKKSSAQITTHYQLDNLVGKQVMAVVNFPPRQIGPFVSEVLTLGVPDLDGEVVLVVPEKQVPNGSKMF
jgi:tRNA-binding protein